MTEPCVKIVHDTVCDMQTIQCVRKVPYTTCRQVADTKTVCCPVTVPRQVTDQDDLRATNRVPARCRSKFA